MLSDDIIRKFYKAGRGLEFMDKTILKNIGMTEHEIEIFLSLIKNGPLSVYEISTKTGFYRQACYDALNRLQEKGFVSFVLKNGKKIFQAISPEKIYGFLEEQKRAYQQILPELLKLKSEGKDDISVEVFKGKSILQIGLRDVIETLKKERGENLCTAIDETIPIKDKTSVTIAEQYERDMIHYKFKERIIIKKGSKGFFKRGNSKYAYIEERYFNSNPVQIYGDKVQIWLWGNPDYLIIIKNKNIADSFRKQFELMWKVTKK